MAVFQASDYSRFRVFYPKELFQALASYCAAIRLPMRILDLGSGTGFASASFLNFYPHAHVTLVEPDLAMLNESRVLNHEDPRFEYIHASAEAFEIDQAYDLVIIGSAWHWMNRELMRKKFEASPVQAIWISEYQFPKAKQYDILNEWIRREFNLKWKTPTQLPRGTFGELTEGIRSSVWFSEKNRRMLLRERDFSLEQFFGMIISQSRYLAFENTLGPEDRFQYRRQLEAELRAFWKSDSHLTFVLNYEGVFFLRRKF